VVDVLKISVSESMSGRRRELSRFILELLQVAIVNDFDLDFPLFREMIGLEERNGYLIAYRLFIDTVQPG